MAITMGAGVAIALGIALWLAWLMVQRIVTPMASLASAADAIGRGEPAAVPVDADVREVQDVARALGGAATAVRAREAELVHSRSQFESLVAVARMLNTLDLDAVLGTIVESACTLLDAEVATVFRLDAATDTMVLVAGGGTHGVKIDRTTRLPRGMGLVGLAVEQGAAVVSADVLTDERILYEPAMRERVEAGRHRAAIAVPLTVQGRISGALFVGALPGRVFSAVEIRLVTTFADQAAVAIENAELYHDVHRASRAKDEFLAMLGHELRNPLGAIASASSLLGAGGTSQETTERARAVIARQVQHLSRLVDDLLDVSRVTTGKAILVRRPFDLAELVRTLLQVWRSSGRFDRHRVVVEASPVWIDGDEARMEQVLDNLVGNAIKYTPAGGTVTIRVGLEGDSAVLAVTDTGVGMSADLVGQVFELFVQGERTLDRAQGGLGIGLTMVKRLVEMHGGSVSASSHGHGTGSTFRVRVPSVPAPATSARAARPAATSAARRRILVVEDNDDGREMLRVQLTMAGHEVHEAADGPSGVDQATRLQPDVALIDVGLPGLDGYEVARRIRAGSGQSMLLVALTGYGQAEDRRLARDAGFDAHLTKPVRLERLIEVLDAGRTRSAETAAGG
jgi:signal transduction histidine kinase/ActR/RegA family two-component response regulator